MLKLVWWEFGKNLEGKLLRFSRTFIWRHLRYRYRRGAPRHLEGNVRYALCVGGYIWVQPAPVTPTEPFCGRPHPELR